MALWGRRGIKTTKLQRRAAAAERIILKMSEADRAAALEQVQAIAIAIIGLKVLPDELVDVLGRIVVDFLLEQEIGKLPGVRKPSARSLVLQIVDGAPTILGPHRDRIEALVDGA